MTSFPVYSPSPLTSEAEKEKKKINFCDFYSGNFVCVNVKLKYCIMILKPFAYLKHFVQQTIQRSHYYMLDVENKILQYDTNRNVKLHVQK